MKDLFDLTGKVSVITGSTKGIGKAMAEGARRVWIEGRHIEPQGGCLRGGCGRDQRERWRGRWRMPCHVGHKDQLERLVAATRERWGKIDNLVVNAAVNPYYGSSLGILRHGVRQGDGGQHQERPLAVPDGDSRDAGAQGRLDHRRVLDRRLPRQFDARRLCDLESRRHAACAQPGGRVQSRTTSASTAFAPAWSRPTLPARCGRTPKNRKPGSRRPRRYGVWASPRIAPASPSTSPRAPARGPRARPSPSTAESWAAVDSVLPDAHPRGRRRCGAAGRGRAGEEISGRPVTTRAPGVDVSTLETTACGALRRDDLPVLRPA